MKVPLPVSPKRKLRSCSSSPAPPAKDFDRQTRSNVGPENESDSQPDVTELKSKSPFYKKVIDQQQVAETKKVCTEFNLIISLLALILLVILFLHILYSMIM